MKKQLFLMSALAITAFATTSCNKYQGEVYEPGTPLKVGLICIENEGSTYDKNFITAFNAAVEHGRKDGYVSKEDTDVEIKKDVPEKGRGCYDAAEGFVNDKFNVIFSDSFGHDVSMHEAANDFKNVHFSSATGVEAKESGLSNFHNAFASIYQGRYLAGLAGGYHLIEQGKVKTGEPVIIGYVGAYPYAEVISGYTAFYLGIKAAITSEVKDASVEMKVRYTNEWYSVEKEQTAADTLITKDKCVLISQHADSYGAPQACLNNGKIPNVCYNVDLKDDKTFKDIAVAYSKINWEPYYYNVFKSLYEGKAISGETGQNWTGTMGTDSVKWSYNSSMVTKHAEDIAKAEKAMKEGKLHVFDTSTFTVTKNDKRNPNADITLSEGDHGTLTSFKGDTTGDYAPDQELVKDGHVEESVYRSAPSFDLIIDGIEVLE